MGCGVSKIDGIFFRRVQEIRNQPLLKDPTYSKKELLLHDRDVSVHQPVKPEDPMEKEPKKMPRDHKNGENVLNDCKDHETVENTEKSLRENGKHEKENEFEDAWTDADNKDEDDERMIGHGDDGNFPGSPSFRVYFKEDDEDDEHDSIDKSDAFKDKALSEDAISSKEEAVVDKKAIISGRKKGSFRKVLPKGLSMKSCYTSPRSNPDHAHLLIEKT